MGGICSDLWSGLLLFLSLLVVYFLFFLVFESLEVLLLKSQSSPDAWRRVGAEFAFEFVSGCEVSGRFVGFGNDL